MPPVALYNLRNAVVPQKFASVDSQNLHFGIGGQLLEHVLEGVASEIHHVVHQHPEAKGTALGLVAVSSQEAEDLCLVLKSVGFMPHFPK